MPLAWIEGVRHAAFVGMILVMAFAPGGMEKKIGVVGFALAYALNLASRVKTRREAVEETLDDEGITQVIEGRTTRMRWDEIGHFAADHLAMGAFGLHDRSGRLRMTLGRGFDEGGGLVQNTLWNRMGRTIAEHVPYDGTEADPTWRAHARGARWRLFAAIAGIGLCLSPILLRTMLLAFQGEPGMFFVFLLIAFGPFLLGIPLLLQAGKGKPGFLSQPAHEEAALSALLDERAGSLEPTVLELGSRYRYLSSVTGNNAGMSFQSKAPHMGLHGNDAGDLALRFGTHHVLRARLLSDHTVGRPAPVLGGLSAWPRAACGIFRRGRPFKRPHQAESTALPLVLRSAPFQPILVRLRRRSGGVPERMAALLPRPTISGPR